MSVNDEANFSWLKLEKRWLRRYLSQGKPAIGLCLGVQLIANALGARLSPNPEQELGWTTVHKVDHLPQECFSLPDYFNVLQWHSESFEIPRGQCTWRKTKLVAIRCTSWERMYWIFSFIWK